MRSILLVTLLVATATAQSMDLVEKAVSLNLSTLAGYLTDAGLIDTLKGAGPFTVFAPTDEAFAALPQSTRDAIEADTNLLKDVLLYHVVSGRVPSSAVTNNLLADSLNNDTDKIRLNKYTVGSSTVITASGRRVSNPDQDATNGVIHVVDGVLLAPVGNLVAAAQANTALTTLVELVVAGELVDALSGPETSPLTVFAPDNNAFAGGPALDRTNKTLLQAVLKYHITSGAVYSAALTNGMAVESIDDSSTKFFVSITGGNVYVNDAQVTGTDTTATNGVVHILNKPLMPPALDLVDLAIDQGLSELVNAVLAADLGSTLRGGPFTVFAPTNAAFQAAGIDTSDKAKLTRILQYHLVSTVTYDFALSNNQVIDTVLSGESITVTISSSEVRLNGDAKVTATNVQASNGVVHVIDKVLDPDQPTGSAAGLSASLGLALIAAVFRLL